MNVTKYNIINPKTDKTLPYYTKDKYLIIPVPNKVYNYFLECTTYNIEEDRNEYFLLLGKEEFDENCRKCQTDGYGRVKIKPKGEFQEYIEKWSRDTRNIVIAYVESEGQYDVYKIGE